jgi:pimeloyl-ACP methyl ester carboxylesterase
MLIEATHRERTTEVQLRGKVLQGDELDLPTLIWLPDLIEPAENFESFFAHESNKISKVRDVHLLNYRNFGSSDHHDSFEMSDLTNDIVRYMDQNSITMATIGGHGFGAKVATATAIDNMNRFTGVMCLEGGPVDQTYHPEFLELKSYIQKLGKLNLNHMEGSDLNKQIDQVVQNKNWNKIFKQAVNATKGNASWNFNMEGLAKNVEKRISDVATWRDSYGLWPGRVWVNLATYSHWIHLSTNTLPYYNVFPRLNNKFGSQEFNLFGKDESTANHWLHETKDESEQFHLSNRMWRWLKQKDGVDVLLTDRSELGWYYLPDRGTDASVGTGQGEYIPEHVHHNYTKTSK